MVKSILHTELGYTTPVYVWEWEIRVYFSWLVLIVSGLYLLIKEMDIIHKATGLLFLFCGLSWITGLIYILVRNYA